MGHRRWMRSTSFLLMPWLPVCQVIRTILIMSLYKHRLSLFNDENASTLTHWGRVTHICVVKLTTIGSDNGLLPGRRQAIIWTNAGILLIRPLGANFSEILIGVQTFSFKKMELKMSSAKWRPFCLGLNELTPVLFENDLESYYISNKEILLANGWICGRLF